MLGHVVASLAPRVPLLILAGQRDNASKDAAQSVRHLVERERLNKVELFPSAFHALQVAATRTQGHLNLFKFLETSLKLRPVDWEPQYNLTPVTLAEIPQMVLNARPPDQAKNQAKGEAKKDAAVPAEKKAEAAKKLDEEKAAPKADNPN